MKKLFAIMLVSVMGLFTLNSYAGGTTFAKGDWLGSVTVGFGHGFAQRVAVDYGVLDLIDGNAALGVGASLNNTIGWHGGDIFSAIINCSFHYEFVENLDTYVVVGFGGGVGGANGYATGYFDWTSSIGVRYFFNERWAVNGEVGHTNSSYFNVGVTYKF